MADDVVLEHEIDHIEDILVDDDPEALLDLWVLQSRHKHCDITTDVTSPALREEELEALERHFLIDDVASCFATSLATDAETSLDDPSSENGRRAPHNSVDDDIDEVEMTHGQQVETSRSAVQKANKRDGCSLFARKKLSASQTSLLQNGAEVTSGKSTTSEKLSLSKDILLDEENEGLISFDLPFLPLPGRCYDVTERDSKFTTTERQAAIPPPSVSVFQRAEPASKTTEPSRTSRGVTPLTQDENTLHDVTPLVDHSGTSHTHDIEQSDLRSASPRTRPFLSRAQDQIARHRNPVTTSLTVSYGRGSEVMKEIGRSEQQQQQLRKIQEYLETVDVFLNSALNPRSSGQVVRSCVADARENVRKALQELGALQSCDVTIDVASRARPLNDKSITRVTQYGHEAQRKDSLEGMRVMKPADHLGSPHSINVIAPKPPGADGFGEETTAAPIVDLSPCPSGEQQVDESDSSDGTTTSKTTVRAKPPFEAPATPQSVPLPSSEIAPLNPTDAAEVTLERISGEDSLPLLDQNALTDITSVATVSDQRWTLEGSCVSADMSTSADESSYYSDDDDDDDEDLTENGLLCPGDRHGFFRRPLLEFGAGDPDDEVLREERILRHLAAVRQQAVPSAVRVETVVTATGERLGNHLLALDQSRGKEHVNVGHLYPFTSKSSHVPTPSSLQMSECDQVTKDARPRGGRATFATFARFFRPLQSVALFSARQMTSEEFQDSYDKQYDAIKVKRCELDNDIPWDQLQFSDTEDDTKSEKTWREQSSGDDSFTQADRTDSDSYVSASD
ncbi:uncharacterized protein LOC112557464 isoform X3 [Pomacea canaliculata]|uniref:uncharacterized protein LOC112557464 isoform X3 n=1 Tax=Pomacea canaliculata TaxID=400727 RepID=UPI000D73EE82|nr:uncharacterized protein LOC112557464 isoform X3 [Pomacea canaliculata]